MKKRLPFPRTTLVLALVFLASTLAAQEPVIRTLEGHKKDVLSIAFSPDGQYLASGSDDKTLILWEVASGKPIKTFGDNDGDVSCVQFSQDGAWICAVQDGRARIWDIKSGQLISEFKGSITTKETNEISLLEGFITSKTTITMGGTSSTTVTSNLGAVKCIALDAARKNMVTALSRAIWIRDISTKKLILAIRCSGCLNMTISNDGQWLAVYTPTKITVWHLPDLQELKVRGTWRADNGDLQTTPTGCLAFSPNNNVFSAGFGTGLAFFANYYRIGIFSLADGVEMNKLKVDEMKQPLYIDFSPDSKLLLSVHKDDMLKIWEVSSGREIINVVGKVKDINAIDISPDGKYVAYAGNSESVLLWDISEISALKEYTLPMRLTAEKNLDLQKITPLFIPKSEFETDADYQARLTKGEAEKKAIEEKYALKLAQVEKEFNAKKQAEYEQYQAEVQAKIRASLEEATLKIDGVGTYDANTEILPITVNGITQNIKIPKKEAPSFKAKWSSAQVLGMKQLKPDLVSYESFNLAIIHPETGSRYPFGEQRDLAGVVRPTTTTGTTSTAPVMPPVLQLSATLAEPNSNGFLDAEERGRIAVTVTNSGQGTGVSVWVNLKNETADPEISCLGTTRSAEDIAPGQTKTVEFDVEAKSTAQKRLQSFLLSAEEANGFNPGPLKLSFETRPLILPDIQIAHGLTTADHTNIAKPGITTTIQVRVQNRGQGVAKNVHFTVTPPPALVPAENLSAYDFTEIKPNEVRDFEFQVTPNTKAKEEEVIVLGMREAHTDSSFRLIIPINKLSLPIAEFNVPGRETEQVAITDVLSQEADIDKDIPKSRTRNPEAMAVILGVERYKKIGGVTYARRDAQVDRLYAVNVLGVLDDRNHLYFKVDDEVTKGEMALIFTGNSWLKKRVTPNTDLYIFYAGHGAPDLKSQSPYLIPSDGDVNYPEQTGINLGEIYSELEKLPARSITVFLDACFSGANREDQTLFADGRPGGIAVMDPVIQSDKLTVFSASSGTQISSGYPEMKHGLFTYFLLKGLRGEADANKDDAITIAEMESYLSSSVSRQAGLLDREQTPQVRGKNKERILVQY